ncbi:conserved Plasmodium protein, unknown function [Plasmodium vinckei vinckei]|uniref:Uncharacterized protein n=1 Tax=Plasmodium vinckei vinckei TaxID=54757 RepID=A0A449BPW6_PLAVN|nr:conserved Plasmodium protein, unknown function [Plasmodium vinckei vinckei]VEV55419.1 conserved Plasmodium protein, unknown function [Plasmodium vinckei vinckei]
MPTVYTSDEENADDLENKRNKKKKKKKKKNLYSAINELNYSNEDDNLETNLKREKKKKKNIIHINQDEVNNKIDIVTPENVQTEIDNRNGAPNNAAIRNATPNNAAIRNGGPNNTAIRNGTESELSNQESQNDATLESSTTTNTSGSNIFLKVFDKLKKKIIEEKGQPIPSYIINEQDMCELNTVRNSMSQNDDINNGNNFQSGERIQTSNFGTSNPSQEIEMGCLQGLNPNDVMNDNIFTNNRNTQMNIELENANSLAHRDPPTSQNERGQNEQDENSENDILPIKIYNEFLNKSKTYINTMKDKIIKYWQKKVEEANQQLTTQNQVSTQTENENIVEDEYDDPSAIQVLLLLGLICKFPILWFIGSLILCVTPPSHTKTKRWCLISFCFCIVTIIYYITTTNFNSYQPGFFTIIEQNKEYQNIYKPGIIKFTTNQPNNITISNFIILNKYSKYDWIDSTNNKLLPSMDNHFLDWPYILETKPSSNIILSSNLYTFLNRVQVTILFGKGNIYSSKNIELIKSDINTLPDTQNSINFIKFDNITLTDQSIPNDFFGAGLRCEVHDKTGEEKPTENNHKERWYLFWKQYDDIHNKKSNNSIYNLSVPVGEIFFFKTEHTCRLAYIFPKNVNLNNTDIPNNFVEIEKVIIKAN